MIVIKDLCKEYEDGTVALKNVNLTINQGDFVMLLGLSGSGKSTFLRCINQLHKPTSGEIYFDEKKVCDSESIKYVRKNTGMIFQSFNLVKRLSVLENVLCGRLAYNNTLLSCLKIFPQPDIEMATNCIERVGLTDKINNRADQLSGGQQQRVGIARALVQQPKLFLADEPVASLDPNSAKQVLNILREINETDNITMIVSIHNIHLAKEYAKRIIGIRDGQIIFDKDAKFATDEEIGSIYGGENNVI